MRDTVNRLRTKKGDEGFTLIELLVVVVIIGVLVAIAVPVYLNYRKGAADKSAQSDVRAAISAVEQYYTDNGNVYPATVTGTKGNNLTFPAQTGGTAQTVSVSPGNTVVFQNNGSTYVICGQNDSGKTIYVYNSLNGRPVGGSSRTTLADCAANGD